MPSPGSCSSDSKRSISGTDASSLTFRSMTTYADSPSFEMNRASPVSAKPIVPETSGSFAMSASDAAMAAWNAAPRASAPRRPGRPR